MKDPFGREITNLRIALTKRCNLRCFYCHEEGEAQNHRNELTTDEVKKIVKAAAEMGMHKVKYSGGEPLLYPDIDDIIEFSAEYMDDVSITTNGVLLKDRAKKLKNVGLDRVNVSLDTIDPVKYQNITGKKKVREVKKGIEEAITAGLYPVKVNMLLMKGLNDDSIEDMIGFAAETDAILQIIEMTSNEEEIDQDFYQRYHLPLEGLASELEERAVDTETRKMHARKKYFLSEPEVEVELVRTMHNSTFCANCTRLRVTSSAELKPCLLRTDNHVGLREEMEKEDGGDVKAKFIEAINRREPYWRE